MSTVKSFPDKYITKVSTILMTDEVINKMLYYNNECNVDIYSLPEVKNPIKELREKKVFCNRRVEKVFLQGDISIFINLRKDNPATINGKTSRFIETLGLEIGVICHESCRRTFWFDPRTLARYRRETPQLGNGRLQLVGREGERLHRNQELGRSSPPFRDWLYRRSAGN